MYKWNLWPAGLCPCHFKGKNGRFALLPLKKYWVLTRNRWVNWCVCVVSCGHTEHSLQDFLHSKRLWWPFGSHCMLAGAFFPSWTMAELVSEAPTQVHDMQCEYCIFVVPKWGSGSFSAIRQTHPWIRPATVITPLKWYGSEEIGNT